VVGGPVWAALLDIAGSALGGGGRHPGHPAGADYSLHVAAGAGREEVAVLGQPLAAVGHCSHLGADLEHVLVRVLGDAVLN